MRAQLGGLWDLIKMAFSYKNDKAQKQKMIMKIMKKQNNYHNNDINDHGSGYTTLNTPAQHARFYTI